ncbi:hypothetical protein AX16_003660 [Volvariella volvacea WC 439]|nr:hypothetical protein AX16_003660 [Volvariella volvacea WC 439]
MALTASDICKLIAAVVLPPLGVFLEVGCTAHFWINILLTILGYMFVFPSLPPHTHSLRTSSPQPWNHTRTLCDIEVLASRHDLDDLNKSRIPHFCIQRLYVIS